MKQLHDAGGSKQSSGWYVPGTVLCKHYSYLRFSCSLLQVKNEGVHVLTPE